MARLDASALTGGYPGLTVFAGVSLSVESGDLLTILGANGSGKSALLETLQGLLKSTDGVILLDGEPLGAILRVPAPGELRCNMAAGGHAEKTSITPRDREICRQLGPELSKRGLYLVGIDVIGEYLTEVNVTSPTGIVEVDSLQGSSIERAVIDFAERRARRIES